MNTLFDCSPVSVVLFVLNIQRWLYSDAMLRRQSRIYCSRHCMLLLCNLFGI